MDENLQITLLSAAFFPSIAFETPNSQKRQNKGVATERGKLSLT
jgi:hypothetical protein